VILLPVVTGRRLTMAVETGQSSTGSIKTDLRENAVGLPGILMQGIATIGPSSQSSRPLSSSWDSPGW